MDITRNITATQGQSIIDICLQEYGTLDALWHLHRINGYANYPHTLTEGEVVKVDDQDADSIMLRDMQGSQPASYQLSRRILVNRCYLLINDNPAIY